MPSRWPTATDRTPTSAWSTCHRGGAHGRDRRVPDGDLGVPGRQRLLARRGSRGRRHLVIADIPADPSADHRSAAPPAPAGRRLPRRGNRSRRGRPVLRRTVPRCTCGRWPAGSGSRSAWCNWTPDGNPGPATAAGRQRPTPTWIPTPSSSGGQSALLVWNVDGISTIEVRDLSSGYGYPIDIGRRVMPGLVGAARTAGPASWN